MAVGYDPIAQRALDKAHLAHPMPGDYWHDMYCPVARVLSTAGDWVILQKVSGMAGQEIHPNHPKPCAMKKSAFGKWLSYGSIPGTWAHVIPERLPL